ncbi:Ankyrin-3-like protein [Mycena venus]|uniref:Ankyrin-3-like protein n=1 Tax=Mycena venus TaxID=2733690 RepID=A0A8H6XDN4_9AGAR|nr:Ankyrin-3-like protein [Mycena venus]
MAGLLDFPPELILHTVSFLTRLESLDSQPEQLVTDLTSINALSRTNTVLFYTLNHTLYGLCASVEPLGKRALLFAVKRQLGSTVDKLVAAGISIHSEYQFRRLNCGLLHIAAGMGLRDMVVKLLGMYGEEMRSMVHARQSHKRTTALDLAAHYGHLEIVRLLVPISPPSGVDNGVSPPPVSDTLEARKLYLSVALGNSAKAGNIEISEYLISEGADVNFVFASRSNDTPLYYAAGSKNLGLVQLLLASGGDPNLCFALFNAARSRKMDIVQALVDGGADIHVHDHDLHNVLRYCGNAELLRFFLERGVDPNLEDRFEETPLHHACKKTNAEVAKAFVELLLQFGARTVEKVSRRGSIPVGIALSMGHSEIVEVLEPLVQNPDLKIRIARLKAAGRTPFTTM